MTYSIDFRKKVLSIRERDHLTLDEAAKRFDIGRASLVRWLKQPEPKAKRERRCPLLPADVLRTDVAEYPDAYQYERAARLGASASGVGKALRRCRISHKKRL